MGDDDHDDHDVATDVYVDNDGGGVMGNNDNADDDGVSGGMMGDNDDADDDDVTGYNDDNDGDGTTMTTTLMATVQWATPSMTSMATARRDTMTTMVLARRTMTAMARRVTTLTTSMATLGWEHGRHRHQAYPLPSRWGDDGGIAMKMAGGGLGLGFGGNSS
jgi:hypothetical protein